MIDERAWSLVAEEPPTETPDWVGRLADTAKFDSRERRAFGWAMYLLSRLTGQYISTAIQGFNSFSREPFYEIADITAGFIPFSNKASGKNDYRVATFNSENNKVVADDKSYGFGVVIGINANSSRQEDVIEDRPSQIVRLHDGFPIVAEARFTDFSAPPNLSGAAAACFARPRASKRFYGPTWSDGIVIARHSLSSVGFSPGTSVSMATGVSHVVADVDGGTTIDAAILDCGKISASATPLSLAPAVAPGTHVNVRGVTRSFSAQVLRVNDHPSYFGNLMAHRVFLDATGSQGDSGSLVTRTPNKDSGGLYMGSTGGGTPEGIVQSMRQIVQYFDIDLFD